MFNRHVQNFPLIQVKGIDQIWKLSETWISVKNEGERRTQVMKDIQPEEFIRVLQDLNLPKFKKIINNYLFDELFMVKYFCTWNTFPDLIIC